MLSLHPSVYDPSLYANFLSADGKLTSDHVRSLPVAFSPDQLRLLPTPTTLMTTSGMSIDIKKYVGPDMVAKHYRNKESSKSNRIDEIIGSIGCLLQERISGGVSIITESILAKDLPNVGQRDVDHRAAQIGKVNSALHLTPKNGLEFWEAALLTADIRKAKGEWVVSAGIKDKKATQINEKGRDKEERKEAARAYRERKRGEAEESFEDDDEDAPPSGVSGSGQ